MRRTKPSLHSFLATPIRKMSLLQGACRAGVEGFMSLQDAPSKRDAYVELFSATLAFVIAIVIMGFVGKYLWNAVVIELFSFAKPARSFWQIVGLMIFVGLVRP